ncbi:MAG: HEAT repeat domain-containing protein [Desulfobacterales bacterium]|jgi:Ca2+/Na+ antiporter
MRKLKLSSPFHPIGILFIGLLIAQVMATTQVYLSNLKLYATVSAVIAAGYLAIPNQQVMGSLQKFVPAFFGGFFFTFTIGAGITLGTMAAAWVWDRFFCRHRYILFLFLSVWGASLLFVNIHGFNLIPTLYFLIIPPVIFKLTAKRQCQTEIRWCRMQQLVHVIPVPLLALLWFTQFDKAIFLDLRDNLLLTNHWGRKFSDFYYSYTLYPAEAFKSLDQKNIKTCALENIQTRSSHENLKSRLMAGGYLLLPNSAIVDLKIVQNRENLDFRSRQRLIFQIPLNQFLSDSQKILQRFSQRIDRQAPFRQITFLSLLLGFPVLIYMVLHAVWYYLLLGFVERKTAGLTASIICLLVGIIVLIYFLSNRSDIIDIKDIPQALESDNWQTRVSALKTIQQQKLKITDYKAYPQLLNSRIPQDRYWLVKTLAYSRGPGTYEDLLTFLNDKNTNVRCMALYALGVRKNPSAINPILERVKQSDSWYSQTYAYHALRTLGWKQTKSP